MREMLMITLLFFLLSGLSYGRGPFPQNPRPARPVVLALDFGVDQARVEGTCPHTFVFTARIRARRQLRYRFVRSDGTRSRIYETAALPFTEGPDYMEWEIKDRWTLNRDFKGWEAIEIVSPVRLVSRRVEISLKCTGAVGPVGPPVRLKPDLTVKGGWRGITVEPVGPVLPPGLKEKQRVRIRVKIKNRYVPTRFCLTTRGRGHGGAFPVLLEGMDYPRGRYRPVKRIIVPGMDRDEEREVVFYDAFPAGTARKYRVTLDYENWICETDENNNQQTAGFGLP
ncbi:CARDB domain-containing protein [Thermosulfurimonas sp. F29]|uniref:CARDB domain-containing protein n=1 Tax=Thermosulfurimonas sp. F29 TaxID=2867247 RepID=UPI001C82FCC1|nr:CARDB domain-containing protein [Thermosulfurimonas sp. F29]MBX6423272.1 hypothetical protein [Thermosulfurimonas sp. F29]